MLLGALAAIALSGPGTPVTRDAPWRLAGISKDQRTLHVVYESGGCQLADGRATVDTSDPTKVRVTVQQTTLAGEYVLCPAIIGSVALDVDLGAPLAGRYVTGGPRFAAFSSSRTMPRVVGLRRKDAVTALGVRRIEARTYGRRAGVVHRQWPRPERPAPRGKANLITGPFDARARLAVAVPDGQTVESVLRHGLRFRFEVDPSVERALDALVACNGQDGGESGRPTRRARGSVRVHIASSQLRRALRRRATSSCQVWVASYPADLRGINDYFVRRTATVTLRHR